MRRGRWTLAACAAALLPLAACKTGGMHTAVSTGTPSAAHNGLHPSCGRQTRSRPAGAVSMTEVLCAPNAAIAAHLSVTEKAVAKHINSIFTKLDLPIDEDDHRRVRAVLAWLHV